MVNLVAQPLTYTLSRVVAPNRILKSAMTERLCSWDNDAIKGRPTPEYLQLYRTWAASAIGTIIIGNIPVDVRYPEAMGNCVIDRDAPWKAEHPALFKQFIDICKAQGSVVIAQLTHAGRQSSMLTTEFPVSASDVQCPPVMGMTFAKPRPMTIEEIADLSDRFAYASKVLYDAGCDGIQLHVAHGYLLSQFLSPRVNLRTDRYGGTLENRSRILFEIIDAVRARVPDLKFIISIKINSADFADGGFSAEESFQLMTQLDPLLDLIELSGGSYESRAFQHVKESTIKREAFFIEFADRIRPHLSNAKLAVTGGFRSLAAMNEALSAKSCDIVGVARPLTAEPALSRDLCDGKSQGAKENLVPSAIQTGSSIAQIKEIANGAPIRDLSDPKVAEDMTAIIMKGR